MGLLPIFGGSGPAFYADFTQGQPSRTTFTRSTTKNILNNTSSLSTIGVDVYPLEFNNNGTPRGALLESSRTNLVLQSQNLTTTWFPTEVTVTGTAGTAPDGTNTAFKVVPNTAFQRHYIQQLIGVTANTNYVVSLFAKAAEYNFATVVFGKGSSPFTRGGVTVDLTTGATEPYAVGIPASNVIITPVQYPDGWWRISCSITMDATSTDGYVELGVSSTLTNYSGFSGDGTSGILMWGAQLEAGNTLSSYISTTTASVVRALDNLTINSLPSFNINAGTFYAEITTPFRDTGNSQMLFQFDDGGNTNALRAFLFSTDGSLRFENRSGGVGTVANSTVVPATNSIARVACSYASGRIAISANGGAVGTAAPAALPVGPLINFRLGRSNTATQFLNGHIRRFVYWPAALPDSQLRQLSLTGAI